MPRQLSESLTEQMQKVQPTSIPSCTQSDIFQDSLSACFPSHLVLLVAVAALRLNHEPCLNEWAYQRADPDPILPSGTPMSGVLRLPTLIATFQEVPVAVLAVPVHAELKVEDQVLDARGENEEEGEEEGAVESVSPGTGDRKRPRRSLTPRWKTILAVDRRRTGTLRQLLL